MTDDFNSMTDVPADDRRPGTASPVNYITPEGLRTLWRDRDMQYAKNDIILRPEQIEVIRSFRLEEVRDLPPEDQAASRIASEVLTWYPPVHGQGSRR